MHMAVPAPAQGLRAMQEALSPLKVKVRVTQSCPTLCNPVDYTAHGILQARILESLFLGS